MVRTNNKVPVLFLIFNRREHAILAMESIKQYKPDDIYIAADGPRPGKMKECVDCKETRDAVMSLINWKCNIHTLFRETNLGCARAISDSINWFFQNEDYGIICEDDILLSPDFFTLCEDILPRYAKNDRIQQIAAFNPSSKKNISNSYTFTKRPQIWGWATWRRAWLNNMDMSMSKWPMLRIWTIIKYYGILQGLYMWFKWNHVYHNIDSSSSWATRWHFAAITNNLISICPKSNLSLNIGCTSGGTHYDVGDKDPYYDKKIGAVLFPLKHPMTVSLDWWQLMMDNLDFLRVRRIGLAKKLKRII